MIGKFNRKVFWIILLIIVIDNLVKEVLLWLNLIRENEDNPIEIIKKWSGYINLNTNVGIERKKWALINILSWLKLKFVSKCQ